MARAHLGRAATVAASAAMLFGAIAEAGDDMATFRVSLQVPVRISMHSSGEPASVTITDDDLARGYLDVPARYHVSHNDRRGYLLQIVHLGGVAREVRVSGLGGTLVIAGDAVEVHRDGQTFEQDVALEFRLVLAPGAQAGRFDWPVALSVQPL